MALQTLTFDDVLATSLNNHRPVMTDNFYRASALLNLLKKKNRQTEEGGARIIEPVAVINPSGFSSYSGSDTLTTIVNQKFDGAQYEWRQVGGTIGIDGTSELLNGGKFGAIKLVTASLDLATKELADQCNTMLYGDGQGNQGKDLNGLQLIVSDAAPVANVGGLSETTYPRWSNVRNDGTTPSYTNATPNLSLVANFGTSTTSTTGGYYAMVGTFVRCTDGEDKPDAILTGLDIWQSYQIVLTPDVRYMSEDEVWRGWTTLTFMGIPVVMDRNAVGTYTNAPARMYFLNSKYLKLVIHSAKNFVTEPWQKPVNQDVRYAKLLMAGQLVASNRRMLGILRVSAA